MVINTDFLPMRVHIILRLSFFVMATVFLHACEMETTSTDPNASVITDKEGKIIEGEYSKFHPDGKLAAVMNFKDRKLHGRAIKYYEDGKTVRSELNYTNGKLDGKQSRYYESGAIYKVEEFVDGKRNGLVKKYREGGKLMSEAVYKNGFASTNLKEYLTDGNLKKKYPKIIIETIDRIGVTGSYTINIYMSDNNKKVEYYLGKLDGGKFMSDNLDRQPSSSKGVYTISYNLSPGQYAITELNIVAKMPTRLNNTYITTRTYDVAIENRK